MSTMSVRVRLLVCVLMLVSTTGVVMAQQLVTQVIQLRYRTPDQIVPVLQPLLAQGGTLSAMNGRLIVRTTPENLAELQDVLAQIDTMQRRLMISVRQDADLEHSERGGQVSGRVEIGDDVVVSSAGKPAPPGATVQGGGVRARVYRSEGQRGERLSQQVQVLDGGQATIRIGQSVPIRSRRWVDTPDGRAWQDVIEYRDIDAGFIVTPRVVGDHVTLDILASGDRVQRQGAADVQVQRVQTSVTGRLGEWIEIAGIGEEAVRRDEEILASSRDARREARRVLLKVDEIE